jgi:hypothetical protein
MNVIGIMIAPVEGHHASVYLDGMMGIEDADHM